MDATTASKNVSAFPFRMKLSEAEISKNLDFLVSQVLPVKDKNMEIREECGKYKNMARGAHQPSGIRRCIGGKTNKNQKIPD